jgi:hypothetical protein
VLSRDDAAPSRTDPRAVARALKESAQPARLPFRQRFELRCADIHQVGCGDVLRAASSQAVVALACEHGALAHGFTGVWYSPKRLAVMAEAVQRA